MAMTMAMTMASVVFFFFIITKKTENF
jgi:hypothetical protein